MKQRMGIIARKLKQWFIRAFTSQGVNKLGVQCQEKGDAIYQYNREVQPNSIKAINVTDQDFWQRIWDENPRLQYAIYRECPNGAEPFDNPEGMATDWIKHLKSKIGHLVDAGLVNRIEGHNEWIHCFQTGYFAAADRFMAALIDECHEQFGGKVHIIVGNFSCGHFSDAPNADGINIVDAFPKTLAKLNACGKCFLGMHEYDRKDLDRLHQEDLAKGGDGYWLCGKFKRVERALKDASYGNVHIAITELGLDDAVDRPEGSPHRGWLHYGDTVEEAVAHFLNEHNLAWYYPLLDESEMTVLASIFGCQMYYKNNWGEWGFDIAHGFPTLLEGIKNLEGEPPSPTPNGGNGMDIKVYDMDGAERDWDFAVEKYGVGFRRREVDPGQKVYRLVELREKSGPASLVTNVRDENDKHMPNVDVALYWPDAPDPPEPATEVQPHDWYRNFVHGLTNENGDVGPGMGPGAYHGKGEGGPHAVWVRDPNIPSDICEKLGMLAGTPHDHLDQKFQLMTVTENGEEDGDGHELKFIGAPLEQDWPSNMLGIAWPTEAAYNADVHATSDVSDDVDTSALKKWEYQGKDYALGEVCADFEGETPRTYRIWAYRLPDPDDKITPVAEYTFDPLGQAPTKKVIFVADYEGEEEEPPPSGDDQARLREIATQVGKFSTELDEIADRWTGNHSTPTELTLRFSDESEVKYTLSSAKASRLRRLLGALKG